MLNINQINLYLESIEAKIEAREKEKQLLLSRDIPFSERVFLVDSREQCRYYFNKSYVKCLSEGDYSLDKFEGIIAVERKSLEDLVQTLIRGRERFENELQRLATYEARCVVVESTFSALLAGNYVSQALPQSIVGLMMSASCRFNIPFFFLDNFALSNRFTQKYLLCFARKKENNYHFPAPARPLELRLEDTVLSYSLSDFIKEITINKIDFKFYINQLKAYKSSAIVLQCNYSDVINKIVNNSNIEDVVMSLIVDHGINVYFMQDENTAKRWIESHLKRYRPSPPPKEKKKRSAKKGSV